MNQESNSNFLIQIITTNGLIRSESLVPRLESMGLKYTLAEGITPSIENFNSGNLHHKFLSSLICQRPISKSEVGCALAHISSARKLLNSDFKYGIIFEDDAEIISDLDLNQFKNFLNSEQPRILVLGWVPGFAISLPNNMQEFDNVIEVAVPPTCAFGYALNHSAAKILSSNNKILDLADWPINTVNKVKFAIVNSPVAYAPQDPLLSIIGNRISNSNQLIFQRLMFRGKFVLNLLVLFVLSLLPNAKFTLNQVINRVLLKDMIYRFGKLGVSRVSKENETKVISELPQNSSKLLRLLRLI